MDIKFVAYIVLAVCAYQTNASANDMIRINKSRAGDYYEYTPKVTITCDDYSHGFCHKTVRFLNHQIPVINLAILRLGMKNPELINIQKICFSSNDCKTYLTFQEK